MINKETIIPNYGECHEENKTKRWWDRRGEDLLQKKIPPESPTWQEGTNMKCHLGKDHSNQRKEQA